MFFSITWGEFAEALRQGGSASIFITTFYMFFSTLEDGMHVLTPSIVSHSVVRLEFFFVDDWLLQLVPANSHQRMKELRRSSRLPSPAGCKAYLSQEGELLTDLHTHYRVPKQSRRSWTEVLVSAPPRPRRYSTITLLKKVQVWKTTTSRTHPGTCFEDVYCRVCLFTIPETSGPRPFSLHFLPPGAHGGPSKCKARLQLLKAGRSRLIKSIIIKKAAHAVF